MFFSCEGIAAWASFFRRYLYNVIMTHCIADLKRHCFIVRRFGIPGLTGIDQDNAKALKVVKNRGRDSWVAETKPLNNRVLARTLGGSFFWWIRVWMYLPCTMPPPNLSAIGVSHLCNATQFQCAWKLL